MTKTPPIQHFRENGITVSIWERTTDNGTFHDLSIKRSYKAGDKWKETSSIPANQIPTLLKLLEDARNFLRK